MGKNRRDKTTGLPLPSPVVPVSTLCVQITIPNAPEYRQALRGVLSDLGKPWQWAQTVGEDNQNAYTAAELWRSALQTLVYVDDCDGSMSCLDVADCIETNPETQTAIDARVSSSTSIQQDVNNYSTVGVPMLPSQRDTTVTGSDGCDLNSVFGSVTAIIDQLNRNNEDFLEIIQLTDNAQQRASKVLKAIPLINELPIDEGLDFISELTGELKENYEAEYTTDYRDTLRCALFCAARAKVDCELTFQDIITIFNDRVGTSLEPINFFVELVEFVLLGSWPGTVAVDVLTLIQLAVWQQASNWTGITLRTLETVGLLGANDDDPDWEILCEDCAVVSGFVAYGTSATTVTRVGNVYTITGGFINTAHTASFIYIGRSIDGAAATGTMTYTSLSINGVTSYDWGDDTSSNLTTPPNSAPPPNVRYAGGGNALGTEASMQIVIETTMPFQGVIMGS